MLVNASKSKQKCLGQLGITRPFLGLLVAPVSVQAGDKRHRRRIWRSLISLSELLSTSSYQNLNEINPIWIQQSRKCKAKLSIIISFINTNIDKVIAHHRTINAENRNSSRHIQFSYKLA